MKYAYCCCNCFNISKYPQISEEIKRHSLIMGDCPVCNSKSQQLVETSDLTDFFDTVFSEYEETTDGEHYLHELETDAMDVGEDLATCIEEDFQIFNPDIFDKTNDLIDSIRNIDSYSDEYFASASSFWCRREQNFTYISEHEFWDMFCDYIKHERRFILDWNKLPFEPKELFSRTSLDIEEGTILYRARKHKEFPINKPFNPNYDEMGAPNPLNIDVDDGRANPIGISYLYLADNIETALKEIRAKQGDFITIAEFEILKKVDARRSIPLKISDLTMNSVKYVNIFEPNRRKENDLANMILALNENISKSVNNKIDYIPTQFLSETIRDLGFDGLRFNSSLDTKGLNYVFFMNDSNDKASIKITKTYLLKIEDSNHKYSIVENTTKFSDNPPIQITPYKVEYPSVLNNSKP